MLDPKNFNLFSHWVVLSTKIMKHCSHATNWLPAAIDIRLIVDHITDKCSNAHTWFWKLIYYLYWQTFLLFEARIVTNQEITVECEWNDKVLKTEGYCIERLNYHGPQFQKQWNGNGQLFCTWWKCSTLQLCIIGGFFFFLFFFFSRWGQFWQWRWELWGWFRFTGPCI